MTSRSARLDSILHKWAGSYTLPEYVKTASADSVYKEDPSEDGSQAGLWLSALQAHYNSEGPAKEAAFKQLLEKAAFYGPDFIKDIELVKNSCLEAPEEENAADYAIYTDVEKWGAIRTPEEYYVAQSWMQKNSANMSHPHYCAMLDHLMDKAAEYKTTVDPEVIKGAFSYFYIEDNPILLKEATYNKICSYITDNICVLKNGSAYHSEQLDKLDSGLLKEAFGDDFMNEVSDCFGKLQAEKLAEVLPTLPSPDASLFDDIMQKSGQACVTKNAEAIDVFEELLKTK